MEAETHAGADIQRNDVLEVIAGPEAGTKWSVEGVHAPGDGSLLLALSVFNGDLPLPPAP